MNSLTSVVEYQFTVFKSRMIFVKKWTGLNKVLKFFDLDERVGDRNLDSLNHFTMSKIAMISQKMNFIKIKMGPIFVS